MYIVLHLPAITHGLNLSVFDELWTDGSRSLSLEPRAGNETERKRQSDPGVKNQLTTFLGDVTWRGCF